MLKTLFIFLLSTGIGLGFNVFNKSKKDFDKQFVLIEEGHVFLNLADTMQKQECQEFWVSKTEVSNGEYRKFLKWTRASEGQSAYQKLLPDTTVWILPESYNGPLVKQYFRHPVYTDYPVVGLSKSQAMAYCQWKSKDSPFTFTLPTRKQFVRAGRGEDQRPYAHGIWINNFDSKGFPCNYRQVDNGYITLDQKTGKLSLIESSSSFLDDGAMYTATGRSYEVNEFGLYNLSGNVAEMLIDEDLALGGSWYDPGYDVRLESERDASEPSSFVGFRLVATAK